MWKCVNCVSVKQGAAEKEHTYCIYSVNFSRLNKYASTSKLLEKGSELMDMNDCGEWNYTGTEKQWLLSGCFLVPESGALYIMSLCLHTGCTWYLKKHYCGINIWIVISEVLWMSNKDKNIYILYIETKLVSDQYGTCMLFISSGCIIWLLKIGTEFITSVNFAKG